MNKVNDLSAVDVKGWLADLYAAYYASTLEEKNNFANYQEISDSAKIQILNLGRLYLAQRDRSSIFFKPKQGAVYKAKTEGRLSNYQDFKVRLALKDTDIVVEQIYYGSPQPMVCCAKREEIRMRIDSETGESELISKHDTSVWVLVHTTRNGKKIIIQPSTPDEAAVYATYFGQRIENQSFWRHWLPVLDVVLPKRS